MLLLATQSIDYSRKREKSQLFPQSDLLDFPFIALVFGGLGWVDMNDNMGMKIRATFEG